MADAAYERLAHHLLSHNLSFAKFVRTEHLNPEMSAAQLESCLAPILGGLSSALACELSTAAEGLILQTLERKLNDVYWPRIRNWEKI